EAFARADAGILRAAKPAASAGIFGVVTRRRLFDRRRGPFAWRQLALLAAQDASDRAADLIERLGIGRTISQIVAEACFDQHRRRLSAVQEGQVGALFWSPIGKRSCGGDRLGELLGELGLCQVQHLDPMGTGIEGVKVYRNIQLMRWLGVVPVYN